MAKKKATGGRDALAASLLASLPDSGGGYEVSSMFSAPERRRILGTWKVTEHRVDGKPFVESFAASALRGVVLADPVYRAVYDFRESLCVKVVEVNGVVDLAEGRTEYAYRMSMAISWELGRGFLNVRPELGYQTTTLGGKPAAVKEFGSTGDGIKISYRFEGGDLILEEGQDSKRLARVKA